MNTTLVENLMIDPGMRTLGQLVQDREAALNEIRRLQFEVDSLQSKLKAIEMRVDHRSAANPSAQLLRIDEVCALLRISRSTVYKRVSAGTFPPPVQLGVRSVRWQRNSIEAWQADLESR